MGNVFSANHLAYQIDLLANSVIVNKKIGMIFLFRRALKTKGQPVRLRTAHFKTKQQIPICICCLRIVGVEQKPR